MSPSAGQVQGVATTVTTPTTRTTPTTATTRTTPTTATTATTAAHPAPVPNGTPVAAPATGALARGVPRRRPASDKPFLATAAARRIHDAILESLAGFASTPGGRAALKARPLQDTPAAALRNAEDAMRCKAQAAALDRDAVRRLLRSVRTPAEPAARVEPGRLVVGDDAVQERLRTMGVHRWAAVASLAELAQAAEYEAVLILDEHEAPGIDNAAELPPDAPLAQVAPEAVLAWFAANRTAIAAAAELGALLGKPGRCGDVLRILDQVPKGGPVPDLVAAARALQPTLRARLRERAATLSLSGAEVLASIGRRLPAGLQAALDETLREARDLLRERTGVTVQAFQSDPLLEVDEEEAQRVMEALRCGSALQLYHARVKAAGALAPLRATVTAEVEAWLAFDADFAVGCFALHHGLHPAILSDRIAFTSSIHLDLAATAGVQRIAYSVGGDEPVVLLTGANSGGKTTLLEHVAQLAIMARLGLPVVGEGVEVPWFEEVHFVATRRSLDAGAFESFLKSFLPLATGETRRLVLADEVESVTELEAAGRILGFFLDRLAQGPSTAVVVTHLAPQILGRTAARVRVDGIEATGLDARNRLVVDRSPRMGVLARSTPELIIQRLAAVTRGPDGRLYADLLAAFRGEAAAGPRAGPTAGRRPGKGKRAGPPSAPT